MLLYAPLLTFFQSCVRPLPEKNVRVDSCGGCGRALLSLRGRRTLGGGRLTLGRGGMLTLGGGVFSQGSRAAGVKLTPEALE